MIRGIRGATTVTENDANEIVANTKELVMEMAEVNKISPDEIATVLISATADINASFPAKALREINGWKYVPVMCMKEIEVPNSLPKCIRVMMTVNSHTRQEEVQHIYHNQAVQLRPDLSR
ncbi:chorismate mutase [Sediminibacillus dalangtanensis]|uniref:chorismate mutase n=1 Tax=Sediminibacillus dalangtanensis TaxID=2729421 RepID=A0ABX7VRU1_9BACI|nr:chorismate mutase [Sediminibacillus dalangtanensis]QTM99652.1 chorismate mutase [Sediminibacillus dalangtanensis]